MARRLSGSARAGSGKVLHSDVIKAPAGVLAAKKNLDIGSHSADFQEVMKRLKVPQNQWNALYRHFVEEIWRIIHLEDVQSFEHEREMHTARSSEPDPMSARSGQPTQPATGHDVMQHIGLCKGGFCFLRFADLVYETLVHRCDKAAVAILLGEAEEEQPEEKKDDEEEDKIDDEDPFTLEFFLTTLLRECAGTGLDGFTVLTMLADETETVEEVGDLVRAHAGHPSRTILLSNEGDFESEKGALRERAARHDVHTLVQAIDAFLCLLLLQARPGLGWTPLRNSPPGSYRRIASVEDRIWEFDDLVTNIVQVVWDEIDVDANDRLSDQESRELLRLLLSRPTFSCTAREWLVNQQPDAGFLKQESLHCCMQAILNLAPESSDVAKEMWLQMDENNNGAVNASEFRELFPKAVKVAVMDRVVVAAREHMTQQHGQKLPAQHIDTPPMSPTAIEDKAESLKGVPAKQETGRPECTMAWVKSWIQTTTGRTCTF